MALFIEAIPPHALAVDSALQEAMDTVYGRFPDYARNCTAKVINENIIIDILDGILEAITKVIGWILAKIKQFLTWIFGSSDKKSAPSGGSTTVRTTTTVTEVFVQSIPEAFLQGDLALDKIVRTYNAGVDIYRELVGKINLS